NKARAFIYSTALPPINVAFTLFIFQKMKEFEDKRQKLQNLAHFFKEKLMQKKYEILGDAYIVSLILNDNLKALEFSQTLENQGFFAPAIKEPTVPKNTARIRFSLHAGLEFDDIERIVNIL
ncbi:aminotransferase class I/II-fold pyridoxal phosphate-dependent enzyme, partial [Campylobacter novaezeelandiae]